MDSIRENRTKEDILMEIQLEQSADIYNKKCFIIVEGSDDILFVKKIFCSNIICLESFNGKSGVHEIIAEKNADNVIGIRDRDYLDEVFLPDRIFLYDHCCLEMMLLSNNIIAKSFYDVYYHGKWSDTDFLTNIMRQLSVYSVLRRKNEKEILHINFQKAGFGDIIDVHNETLDIEELFRRVSQEELYAQCKVEADGLADEFLWEITNGHDMCMYLGKLSKSGHKSLGQADVRNFLIACYRKEDFKQTDLFKKILQYQRQFQLNFLDEN